MNDSSQKIGDFLLKGWTMLGDNCPHGCNVPLMRSRDKKSLVCLGCDTDFLAEKQCESTTSKSEVVSKQSLSPSFGAVIDSKLEWVVQEINKSSSVSDLTTLVELATKLVALRNSIYFLMLI